MTDRIKRMQAALKVDKFPFCAEKAKLVIESWNCLLYTSPSPRDS